MRTVQIVVHSKFNSGPWPTQYLAASGVGVSVLLRRPHGFEGLLPRGIHVEGDHLAIPDPEDEPERAGHRNTTVIAASFLRDSDDDLIPGLDELVSPHRE